MDAMLCWIGYHSVPCGLCRVRMSHSASPIIKKPTSFAGAKLRVVLVDPCHPPPCVRSGSKNPLSIRGTCDNGGSEAGKNILSEIVPH